MVGDVEAGVVKFSCFPYGIGWRTVVRSDNMHLVMTLDLHRRIVASAQVIRRIADHEKPVEFIEQS
jgi:hypothetical protein